MIPYMGEGIGMVRVIKKETGDKSIRSRDFPLGGKVFSLPLSAEKTRNSTILLTEGSLV